MNRRIFLRSAAVAGAGLALSRGGPVRSQSGTEPDDINVALLGAGHEGQILMNSCRRIPGIRFKALCDIWTKYNLRRISFDLQKYNQTHNAYEDYREMLDKEKGKLDAVIVATPDFWHSRQVIDCLEAGLHVYCETPMSNTVQGAGNMVQASRRTGKLLQIGCQRRSDPPYLHCYEKLLHGYEIFGRIVAASAQWNRVETVPLGWPRRAGLDQATLERYGYDSMASSAIGDGTVGWEADRLLITGRIR
ncbi:MAG: Gfo/Idh/MocA family oxidoreductase [Sedimentisphaerales bacterium]